MKNSCKTKSALRKKGITLSHNIQFCIGLRIDFEVKMASCEDVALSKTHSHRGPRLALTL